MSFFAKIFGDPNEKVVKNLQKTVDQVNQLEPKFESFSDEQLREKTKEFQKEYKGGKKLDDILPEAFAIVREAAKRTLKQRHFDVQMIGGLVLHQGKISEMKTGEGKTLAATLPMYLNALAGQGVHLVTVNDYLARRDTVWMGKIYHLLGLSVACIQHDAAFLYDPDIKKDEASGGMVVAVEMESLRPVTRQEAYQADITYGTNNEFGFDYLRDNMVQDKRQKVQRHLKYAIVDEVDSILVDEARTPLIISAPAEEATEQYYKFSSLVQKLKENKDYNIDEKMRAATLTAEGIANMEKWLGVDNIYEVGGIRMVHHIEQALKARALFKRDKDYVVKEGEIIIVDEFTGRLMQGRRYSEGLHQAIEAKEGVEIKKESRTLATITFQNYFRMYDKLAGMTGTAATEAEEFSKIYSLEVVIIPTNKPLIRKDRADSIYKTEEGKFKAVARKIKEMHERGQPVLVGTISIEKNEVLGDSLEKEGVPHNLLNAKHHEKEAEIIAQAGRVGAVTVATNMAGRGVDIVFGGNPPDSEEAKKVKEAGGLAVIGTERHEARRIDNQLRGRSGRQGDPGSSQFFVSMEDDLMRIFGSERIKSIMTTLGVPDDMPIENRMISKQIEAAQHKVEGHNFDIRKHLVEYDDVINKHREVIYERRKKILDMADHPENLKKEMMHTIKAEIEQVVSFHTNLDDENKWDIKEIYEVANSIFPMPEGSRQELEKIHQEAGGKLQDVASRTHLIEHLAGLSQEAYRELTEKIGDAKIMTQIEKAIMLRSIDTLWIEHLDQMSHLRQGIGLRGYGQKDPLVEYKKESYQLFNELIGNIQKQAVYSIYKVGLAKDMVPGAMQTPQQTTSAPSKTMEEGKGQFSGVSMTKPSAIEQESTSQQQKGSQAQVASKPRDESGKKVGRNDPCPCGSGKKYKKCHGR